MKFVIWTLAKPCGYLGRNLSRCIGLLVCLSAISNVGMANDEFPYRAKYSSLKVMSTSDLKRDFAQFLIIDVRSKFEFDVMKIKGAVLLPMSNMSFLPGLEKLRGKTDAKKIVFYCNGKTCEKSYEACAAADKEGYKNIYVYDAGVFDWVNAHPESGEFFGNSPVDKSKIIEKSFLKSKGLNFAAFKTGAEKSGAVAIDIREPIQRKFVPEIKGLKNTQLDKLLAALETGELKGKELFFVDAVGKQTQWLQYYLERNGYKNYFFLEGGAEGQATVKK